MGPGGNVSGVTPGPRDLPHSWWDIQTSKGAKYPSLRWSVCSLGPCVSFKWLRSCGPFIWDWILSTCMIHNNDLLSVSCPCLFIIGVVISPFICLVVVVYFLALLCHNVLLARSVVVTSTTSN